MKVSSTFSKVVESKGEPSPGVPPFFLWVCTGAPLRWVGGVGLSCDSTPFLWCLPKETVSSRQRKALFLPRWLHHSRERYCLGGRGSSSPDLWRGRWSSERLPSPGANGICYGRFARSVYCTGVTVVIRFRPPPKARFFGAPPRFFAQEQRNGVELAVGGGSF